MAYKFLNLGIQGNEIQRRLNLLEKVDLSSEEVKRRLDLLKNIENEDEIT